MADAAERDLPASKPLGESENFDVVVGRPGKFVGVQVKGTVAPSRSGEGYVCTVGRTNKLYRAGAFDFLVAYVIPQKAWYILPAKEVVGMHAVSLGSPGGRYEKYREAWELLREAVGPSEDAAAGMVEEAPLEPGMIPRNAVQRMQASFNFVKRHFER